MNPPFTYSCQDLGDVLTLTSSLGYVCQCKIVKKIKLLYQLAEASFPVAEDVKTQVLQWVSI